MSYEKRNLTIAFLPASDMGLSFRGSEVAMWSYMVGNEKYLGNKSILCLGKNAKNEPTVLDLFVARFGESIIYFTDSEDLEKQLLDKNVDALYCIRYGRPQEPVMKVIPQLIHVVYDMSTPHRFVYAAVSESVAKQFARTEFVPHIVELADSCDDYRERFSIPKDALVFGRHGGADTWDKTDVKEVVLRLLRERPDVYFLFAVRPFILQDVAHPRLICFEPFADPIIKRKFINTIDFFLHAQNLGDTFGLSCAEASQANKPVIVWNGGRAQEHLRILGEKCIKYNDSEELYKILSSINRDELQKKDWRAYHEYTPEKVMKQFDGVFLDPVRKHLGISV